MDLSQLKSERAELSSEIIYFVRMWLRDEPARDWKKKDEFYKLLGKYDDLCDKVEDAAALAQADKQESPEKCRECGDDLGDDAILGTCPACAYALAGDAYQG